ERIDAGVRLGRLAPSWLGAAAESALLRARDPDGVRGWLAALATTARPVERTQAEPWARLLGWALDAARHEADRCLALAALSGASKARTDAEELDALAADPSPTLRACAVMAAGRSSIARIPAAALVDPDARVRVAAALSLANAEVEVRDGDLGRLAILRARDPIGEVRAAAALALSRRRTSAAGAAGGLVVFRRAPEFPWVDAAPWEELALDGTPDRSSGPASDRGFDRV